MAQSPEVNNDAIVTVSTVTELQYVHNRNRCGRSQLTYQAAVTRRVI